MFPLILQYKGGEIAENMLVMPLPCPPLNSTTIFLLLAQDLKAPSGLSGRLHHFIFIVLHISLSESERNLGEREKEHTNVTEASGSTRGS